MLSADSANSTAWGYHVGVDIGGTFTDLVTVAENRETYRAKALTTPADYTRGIMCLASGPDIR
jgi:N-methylhydantoinase A